MKFFTVVGDGVSQKKSEVSPSTAVYIDSTLTSQSYLLNARYLHISATKPPSYLRKRVEDDCDSWSRSCSVFQKSQLATFYAKTCNVEGRASSH